MTGLPTGRPVATKREKGEEKPKAGTVRLGRACPTLLKNERDGAPVKATA